MSGREPGTVLDGKYEVVKPLAEGGMGEVHLVRHLHLEELRVVKILRPEVASNPAHRKRFLREARLATQVKHPNVAILYDFAQLPEGAFYMVWEHVEGQEVGERLHERGPFALPEAIELAIQALRGLEAIHTLGVIHRDVSPDNLMLTTDARGRARLKIIDLGLARTLNPDPDFEVTLAGTFMGKLRYCSPEQAEMKQGEELDRRSDLYSFGLVLYEMISGTTPFEDGDRPAFVFQRLERDPLPLAGRVPGLEVPVVLDRAVMKALERDRERRYRDAVEFIEAIERVGRSLGDASTQPIEIAAAATVGPPGARPAAPAAGPPRQRTPSHELSPDERRNLLDQIDRAAKRVRETTQVVERADLALAAGELGEARRLIGQLEAANPAARGLGELKEKLAKAEGGSLAERVAEVEKMLGGYIRTKQLALAELAYDSLVELAPRHPRQGDYLGWIEMMRGELETDRRAGEARTAGREALAAGDFKAARRALDTLRKVDVEGDLAAAFEGELAAAEEEHRQDEALGKRVRRFDDLLARGRLEEAARALAEMGRLGASRVTLDRLRARYEEARRQAAAAERAAAHEKRFHERLAAGDYAGAREAAVATGRELPGSQRAADLLSAAARHERDHQRRLAIEQGERQVEALIERGDAAQAELALSVLLRLDPKLRKRKLLERRIRALAG